MYVLAQITGCEGKEFGERAEGLEAAVVGEIGKYGSQARTKTPVAPYHFGPLNRLVINLVKVSVLQRWVMDANFQASFY